jgi:hypothetical protein
MYPLMFVLKHRLFQYFKLVEVYVVMIPSGMEDEQCFSIVFFMKFNLINKLTNHLHEHAKTHVNFCFHIHVGE